VTILPSRRDAPPAGLGRRALAWALDQVAAGICGGGVALAVLVPRALTAAGDGAGRPPLAPITAGQQVALVGAAVLLAGLGVLQWWALGARGWTLGKLLLRLRVVDARTGDAIGARRALVRGLVLAAGALACGVGQLVVLASPLLDPDGRSRSWPDRTTGSSVRDVRDVRGGAQPVPRAGARPSAAAAAAAPARLVELPSAGAAVNGVGAARRRDVVQQGNDMLRGDDVLQGDPVQRREAVAQRLGALLAERRSGIRPVELAPFPLAGVSPDVDTRTIAAVAPVPPGVPVPHLADRAPAALATAGRAPGDPAPGLDPALEMTRRGPLTAAERRGATATGDAMSADIELSDGRIVTVARTAFVGRNPTGDGDAQLVRMVDPGRSVSKTHLQVGVTEGGVWVVDRGSTNGTLVTLADGQQIVCGTARRVRVPLGATVSFGDCSLTVVRLPEPAVET